MKKIGFIGTGHMGSALSLVAAKALPGEQIEAFDTHPGRLEELAEASGCCKAGSCAQIARDCEIIMVCVKPPAVTPVLEDIMPVLRENYEAGKKQVICSIAAGLTLSAITEVFAGAGMDMPVIRLLPNIPVSVGKGVLLFANNPYATDGDVGELMEILVGGGLCEHVTEEMMCIACPVFSCSPAFVYMFIESMADGSVQIGMTKDQALRMAAQAVLGSAAMVLETGKHPGQLKDELATPGGMTIGAANELERCGFRSAAIQAIVTAYNRQDKLV